MKNYDPLVTILIPKNVFFFNLEFIGNGCGFYLLYKENNLTNSSFRLELVSEEEAAYFIYRKNKF